MLRWCYNLFHSLKPVCILGLPKNVRTVYIVYLSYTHVVKHGNRCIHRTSESSEPVVNLTCQTYSLANFMSIFDVAMARKQNIILQYCDCSVTVKTAYDSVPKLKLQTLLGLELYWVIPDIFVIQVTCKVIFFGPVFYLFIYFIVFTSFTLTVLHFVKIPLFTLVLSARKILIVLFFSIFVIEN